MGMCVDLREGQSVIIECGGERIAVNMLRKLGDSQARVEFIAPPSVKLIPPNKQQKEITPR